MDIPPGFVGGAVGSGTKMKVWENTRGWPSIARAGVFGGFPAGPLPWVTFPDTVTNNEGGWAPRRLSDGSERQSNDTYLALGDNQTTVLRV